MIKIIDNLFSDVDQIVSFAQKQKFYSKDDHPDQGGHWKGNRTLSIYSLDKDLDKHLVQIIQEKTELKYNTYQLYFHYLMQQHVNNTNWFHQDIGVDVAGVVYLNKDPISSIGTVVVLEEKLNPIENVYNRGVFYDSDIWHAPAGGYGNNIENTRLTLNIFMTK